MTGIQRKITEEATSSEQEVEDDVAPLAATGHLNLDHAIFMT
jgi:hypothetical protein